jgi:hypothetical protein
LLLDFPCKAHIVHRIVEKTFGTVKLIPKLHSVAFSCNPPGNQKAIGKALFAVVKADLEFGFFPRSRPHPSYLEHNRGVLSISLLRSLDTRGRNEVESMSAADDALRGFSKTCLNLLNGDWRVSRVQHFCHEEGCCEGHNVEITAQRITALVTQVLFEPLSQRLPSQNRWYTFPRSLEVQRFGALCPRRA